MCIDYSDLNNACPKDHYPFPEIDQKVESLEGFQLKCFLDAYKGYHQVHMCREDEEKIAFHTNCGTFCYQKMPFGLKNVGATYQHIIDKVFAEKIRKNVEVYIDDMVIKSSNETMLLQDIEETLQTLAKAQMKLNPRKCTFRVEEGQFPGYQITKEGIAPNQAKIQEFLDSRTPHNIKGVQEINETLIMLG